MKDYLEGYSITSGTLRYSDLGYLLATDDALIAQGVAHTRVITIDQGDWGGDDLDWLASSSAVCHDPQERFIAAAQLGHTTWVAGGGQASEEAITTNSARSVQSRGYIREIREIAGGKLYAAGTCRQLYRRDGPANWVCLDIWQKDESDEILDCSFESVDGFSEEEIYTVGWEGEIWLFNGSSWKQIESPTNVSLYKVLCAPDGNVYAAGTFGTLLRGKGDAWELIEHEDTTDDIWGLAWFEGQLYLSTTSVVYRLDGDQLKLVDYGDGEVPTTCYHLSAADGILWSIGAKDVVQFDGSKWTRIY